VLEEKYGIAHTDLIVVLKLALPNRQAIHVRSVAAVEIGDVDLALHGSHNTMAPRRGPIVKLERVAHLTAHGEFASIQFNRLTAHGPLQGDQDGTDWGRVEVHVP